MQVRGRGGGVGGEEKREKGEGEGAKHAPALVCGWLNSALCLVLPRLGFYGPCPCSRGANEHYHEGTKGRVDYRVGIYIPT